MPYDAVTVREDVVVKSSFGGHDMIMQQKYEAPDPGESGLDVDPFKLKDFEAAKTMSDWLQREYPGHLWATKSDIRQGVVMFNIPILMGTEKWWVVNLRTHDIIDGLRQGAGQILERYRLNRGRFVLDQFLEAREINSILVNRTRKVPE